MAVHSAFLFTLFLTTILFIFYLEEPHIRAGFDVSYDGRVSHVAAASPAADAGLSVGASLDRIRIREDVAAGTELTSFELAGNEAAIELSVIAKPITVLTALEWFPWYRYWMLAIGMAAWGVGLLTFVRNPDAPGIVPFAFWSALALPFIFTSGYSLAWSEVTAGFNTFSAIVVGIAFHAIILHWLIVFPTGVGRRRAVMLVYGIAVLLALLLLTSALQGRPEFFLRLVFLVAGVAAIALCVFNLCIASSERDVRKAGLVLLPFIAFVVTALSVREIPIVAGVDLPLPAHLAESLIALVFLAIPLSVLTAVTRSDLFQIDRLINRTITYAAVAIVFVVAYVVLSGAISLLFDRAVGGDLPLFAALWILFILALVVRPVQRTIQSRVDAFFEREKSEREKLLLRFKTEIDTTEDRNQIDEAYCSLVEEGLGVRKCKLVTDGSAAKLAARPGAAHADEKFKEMTLEHFLDPEVMLRVPLASSGFVVGYAELGKKKSEQRYASADISFVREAGREYVQAVERFSLKLRALQRKLQLAQTREQIASDLHDEIGSGLSTIALIAELLERNPGIGDEGRAQLQVIQNSARELAGSISNIVWSMLPEAEILENLLLRMKDIAHQMLGKMKVDFRTEGSKSTEIADLRVRRNVLLIFKEILHNIMRHSGADRCMVNIRIDNQQLILNVEDNGRGFTPSSVKEGYGLRSMRMRSDQIGGRLDVRSIEGKGTSVTLHAPLTTPTPSVQDNASP